MTDTLLFQTANAILREALASDYGIVILCESPQPMTSISLRAKQVLYRFKRENRDYDGLKIRLSPDDPENRLWITKE